VYAALDELIASASFGKAERPARFLRHLVQTALSGEAHLLKESVLGTDVFERPASWDPRLDPVVRQEAARLRKRLARYYENGGAAARIRIELPVGSYVPVFTETPDAIEMAAPVEAEPQTPATGSSSRRRVRAYTLAGVLLVAGAVTAWLTLFPRESRPSLVVLPFTNLTGDAANQFFADGLTDEVTDSLARLKALRVIARSSAFQFKGKAVDAREIGRSLNVSDVVEGSIERSGDRVRIVAHLERASDGSLLWSNTYERKASDLFAIQSELASGIAGGLRVADAIPASKHVPNAEAHEAVLKAHYETQAMSVEALARTESDYQHAIDLDPEYADAYLGLATAKYNEFAARGSINQAPFVRAEAERMFRKALALDPDLPSAHAMLAALSMQYDWDWRGAERELQQAVAGSSSATAESYYAFFLIFRGRFAEADRHLQKMRDLDPVSTASMNNLGLSRNLEGRFAQAREICQQVAAEHPGIISMPQMIGLTYVEEGRPELALPIFQGLKTRFPQAQVFEAMAQAKAGHRDEALRLTRPYEDKYPNSGIAMQWLALVYAFLGDGPNTVKWLQRSADQHEWQALNLAVHPVYSPMRHLPEFQTLERRMGLLE
jgi:serine/threonine-protein kinase